MKFFEKALRLITLDKLIRSQSTGNAAELGAKLGISRSQMLYHLGALKDFGFPIEWSDEHNSYIYTDPDALEVCFPIRFKKDKGQDPKP